MSEDIKPEDIIRLMDCSGAKVCGIARYTKEEINQARREGAARMLNLIDELDRVDEIGCLTEKEIKELWQAFEKEDSK